MGWKWYCTCGFKSEKQIDKQTRFKENLKVTHICIKVELFLWRFFSSQICVSLLLFCISITKENYNFIKKETLTQVFLVNFTKFLRIPFLEPPDGCFWNYYSEQLRKFSPEWKALCNINFLNLFNQVEIFRSDWKFSYNQPCRCLTGFQMLIFSEGCFEK